MLLNEYNDVVEKFANAMENSFITPKAIPSDQRERAFINLIPSQIFSKKIKEQNGDLLYYSESGNKARIASKIMDDKGYCSEDTKKNKGLKKLSKNDDDFVLGQHNCFSFYECYAREIIFQLFKYPIMSYHKYDLLITEDESIPHLNWMKNPNFHCLKNDLPQKGVEPKKNIKERIGNNLEQIKEIEHGNDTDFQLTKNISLNASESSDMDNNINSKKNKKNKTKKAKYNFSSSEGATQPSSRSKNHNFEKNEKNKEEMNKNKNINIKEKKVNNKYYSMPKQKNEADDTSMQQIPAKKISHSNNNKDKVSIRKIIRIKGDFDFLIHSLKGSVLEEVLTNKEIAPFIFYGNFKVDTKRKYDIIGEIKENSASHDDLIEQAQKYQNLIRNFPKNDNLNERLCFKKENKKIIMYVFNSKYHNFIKDILDFKINRDRFKEMSKRTDNQYCKNFVDSFIKYKDEYEVFEKENGLLKSIITSGIPFVFIFVQNIMKLFQIKEKENNELKKKVNALNGYINGFKEKNKEAKNGMQNEKSLREELNIAINEAVKGMKEKILKLENENAKEKEETEKMKLEIKELKNRVFGLDEEKKMLYQKLNEK